MKWIFSLIFGKKVHVIYQPDNYGPYLHKSAAKVAPVSSSRYATQAGTDQKFRHHKSLSEFQAEKNHLNLFLFTRVIESVKIFVNRNAYYSTAMFFIKTRYISAPPKLILTGVLVIIFRLNTLYFLINKSTKTLRSNKQRADFRNKNLLFEIEWLRCIL